MLDSALRGMTTAILLIFLIPRWLQAVINKNTHNLIYVNLKANVTFILPVYLTLHMQLTNY
jgi:hypothetical protein